MRAHADFISLNELKIKFRVYSVVALSRMRMFIVKQVLRSVKQYGLKSSSTMTWLIFVLLVHCLDVPNVEGKLIASSSFKALADFWALSGWG